MNLTFKQQFFSDSIPSKNLKKKKRFDKIKQKSLSPLSKRMAFMHGNKGAPEDMHLKLCNQVYPPNTQNEKSDQIDEYETRVNKYFTAFVIVIHFKYVLRVYNFLGTKVFGINTG